MPEKPFYLAVSALIRDGAGRILLLKRAADDPVNPGKWDLPGGTLDPGETFDRALRREETRVRVTLRHVAGELDLATKRIACLMAMPIGPRSPSARSTRITPRLRQGRRRRWTLRSSSGAVSGWRMSFPADRGGWRLYGCFPGLPDAWILHAIAVRHPFPNGNKCTAFAVADAILREEWGFPIGASQKEREVRGVKVIPSKLYLSRYRHHLHADEDDSRAEEGSPEDPA